MSDMTLASALATALAKMTKKIQKLTWNFTYILKMSATNFSGVEDDVVRGLLARESEKVKKDIGDG